MKYENVLDLVDDKDPILKQVLPDFVFSEETKDQAIKIAQQLGESMLEHGGVGLAANQIGLNARAFAVRTDPVIIMFNPRVVDISQEEIVLDEGCLSFPGVLLKIKRPRHIRVRFEDPHGQTQTEKYTGMTARVILHELDHLNGIVFLDHVGKVAKDVAKRKLQKAKKLRDLRNKFKGAIAQR